MQRRGTGWSNLLGHVAVQHQKSKGHHEETVAYFSNQSTKSHPTYGLMSKKHRPSTSGVIGFAANLGHFFFVNTREYSNLPALSVNTLKKYILKATLATEKVINCQLNTAISKRFLKSPMPSTQIHSCGQGLVDRTRRYNLESTLLDGQTRNLKMGANLHHLFLSRASFVKLNLSEQCLCHDSKVFGTDTHFTSPLAKELQLNVSLLVPEADAELVSLKRTLVDFNSVSSALQRDNIDLVASRFFLMRQ